MWAPVLRVPAWVLHGPCAALSLGSVALHLLLETSTGPSAAPSPCGPWGLSLTPGTVYPTVLANWPFSQLTGTCLSQSLMCPQPAPGPGCLLLSALDTPCPALLSSQAPGLALPQTLALCVPGGVFCPSRGPGLQGRLPSGETVAGRQGLGLELPGYSHQGGLGEEEPASARPRMAAGGKADPAG